MSHEIITQPLPMDIRNTSFRGQCCEGWDFSRRDIRGCDFRDTKLNNANFKSVTAGRSERQLIIDILINGSIALIVGSTISFVIAGAFTFAGTFAGAAIVLIAVSATILVAGAGKSECEISGLGSFIGAVSGAFTGTGLTVEKLFRAGKITEGYFLFFLALGFLVIALIMIYKAAQQIQNSTGTSFKGAKMKGIDFSHAILNNCNFDDAETAYVNWYHAQGTRSTIDFNNPRMQLLISRKGNNSIHSDRDLSDLHLTEVELVKANLSGADLTRSNLQNADFTLTNLTNVKAGDTDFRNATFTGACIQNWTINTGTKFDQLICEHIFLTPDRNPQNRRPLSGSFEPGDFEKLVGKFADSLDFILRRGTDPVAFTQALNEFKQDNPEARIKAIVDLDADRALIQFTIPENSNKVEIHEVFQKLYAAQAEIRYLEGRLESGLNETTNSRSMMRSLFAALKTNIKVIQANTPEGDLMPENRTQYQASGDVNIAQGKSAINTGIGAAAAGNISGTLNLSLATLKESEVPKVNELVDLIEQLRSAIDSPDSELENRHKERALDYLNNLTKLAKDQPENLITSARENLDDLADIAKKGSEIATFAEKYLPTFTAAIDGLRLWFGI
jgi:uncharacterized protein YjbI with pentapeptide repeats